MVKGPILALLAGVLALLGLRPGGPAETRHPEPPAARRTAVRAAPHGPAEPAPGPGRPASDPSDIEDAFDRIAGIAAAGPGGASEIPELLRLSGGSPDCLRAAREALDLVDPEGTARVPHLVRWSAETGPAGIDADAEIRALGPRAVPGLLAALDDEEACCVAIRFLGELGPDAGPDAAAALAVLSGDSDRWKAGRAALALLRMDPTREEMLGPALRANPDWAELREILGASAPLRLADLLSDPDVDVRAAAACGLKAAGEAAGPALQALRCALGDEAPCVRQAAATALARLDPDGADLARELLFTVEDYGWGPPDGSFAALLSLGPRLAGVAGDLRVLLEDGSPDTQERAVEALAATGDPTVLCPPLLAVLGRSGAVDDVLDAAADALARHPVDVPGLVSSLAVRLERPLTRVTIRNVHGRRRQSESVESGSYAAARALRGLGPAAAAAIPALVRALELGPRVAEEAAAALAAIGPEGIAALADALRRAEPSSPARLAVLKALRPVGAAAAPAADGLRAALADPMDEVRGLAAVVLLVLGGDPPGAVEVLSAVLANEEIGAGDRRRWLREVTEARPDLYLLLAPRLAGVEGVELELAAAGWRIRGDPAPLLARLPAEIEDGDADRAVGLIGDLGSAARPIAGAIARLLAASAWPAAGNARRALDALGPHSATAVPEMAEMLREDVGRENVLAALARIGPAAAGAVPAIRSCLDSEWIAERRGAAAALDAILR